MHSQFFKCILVEEKNVRSAVKIPPYSSSSVLGQNALKMVEGAVKRKEAAHSSGQPKEKKKKSALDEIMEVIIRQDLFLCASVPVTMSTSPGRAFEVTSDLQFIWNSNFHILPGKIIFFPHKIGFIFS